MNGLMSITIVLSRWLDMSKRLCSINFKLFGVGLIQSFWAFVEYSCSISDITRLIEHNVDRVCWVLKDSFLNVTADSINLLQFLLMMSSKLSVSNMLIPVFKNIWCCKHLLLPGFEDMLLNLPDSFPHNLHNGWSGFFLYILLGVIFSVTIFSLFILSANVLNRLVVLIWSLQNLIWIISALAFFSAKSECS